MRGGVLVAELEIHQKHNGKLAPCFLLSYSGRRLKEYFGGVGKVG